MDVWVLGAVHVQHQVPQATVVHGKHDVRARLAGVSRRSTRAGVPSGADEYQWPSDERSGLGFPFDRISSRTQESAPRINQTRSMMVGNLLYALNDIPVDFRLEPPELLRDKGNVDHVRPGLCIGPPCQEVLSRLSVKLPEEELDNLAAQLRERRRNQVLG